MVADESSETNPYLSPKQEAAGGNKPSGLSWGTAGRLLHCRSLWNVLLHVCVPQTVYRGYLRKDFTLWGIALKTVLIASQVSGLPRFPKFIGIKVISEMPAHRRAMAILGLIGFAELSLLGFAVVPNSIKPIMLFSERIATGHGVRISAGLFGRP